MANCYWVEGECCRSPALLSVWLASVVFIPAQALTCDVSGEAERRDGWKFAITAA